MTSAFTHLSPTPRFSEFIISLLPAKIHRPSSIMDTFRNLFARPDPQAQVRLPHPPISIPHRSKTTLTKHTNPPHHPVPQMQRPHPLQHPQTRPRHHRQQAKRNQNKKPHPPSRQARAARPRPRKASPKGSPRLCPRARPPAPRVSPRNHLQSPAQLGADASQRGVCGAQD